MIIRVFDVAHGFCAYVVADSGNTLLIDCGHNDETGFYPVQGLLAAGCTGIDRFFVLNYDEDHLSGLPTLRLAGGAIPIRILHRNLSLSAQQLRALKQQSGPLGPGMVALLDMMEGYTVLETPPLPPQYQNLEYDTYCNFYPVFDDTNNLSLVLFLHTPGLSIVFPGDLEKAGWKALLAQVAFQAQLARVNVFVASHHGRESGYEPEVFTLCKPDIVIISDEAKQFDTQETNYAQHARGIRWNQTEVRKVLTTRRDGLLTITAPGGSGYYVQSSR